MFCTECGNKIDDDAKFCSGCGASIVLDNEAQSEEHASFDCDTQPEEIADYKEVETSTKIKLTSKGRISRQVFWKYMGISFLIMMVGSFLIGCVSSLFAQDEYMPPIVSIIIVLVSVVFFLFALAIGLYGFVRRLHDLAIPDEAVFLVFFPPVNLFLLIYCGCVEGAKGANKYGQCSNCL